MQGSLSSLSDVVQQGHLPKSTVDITVVSLTDEMFSVPEYRDFLRTKIARELADTALHETVHQVEFHAEPDTAFKRAFTQLESLIPKAQRVVYEERLAQTLDDYTLKEGSGSV